MSSPVSITSNLTQMDFDTIYEFIRTSYWAKNIPKETLIKALNHSVCFAAVTEECKTVAFARVITDKATFGYLADVFVLPEYRGQGISRQIMDAVVAHPELHGLRRFMLATRDAHGLYEKYGFTPVTDAAPLMQIWQPAIYQEETPPHEQ